ncbi:Uncharacterised protein [Yersinia kristensenii]|uniref:Uncharacterized protein n=1 Tax=Yersinia kristensenii TaxID=28152 RepID=A0A0T9KIG0_YERKR|nr:Uncharacterised protein [Yersinia kristensenii]CNG21633.1 Uncharacterised protein [Yersinia kristensenii]CNJ78214.1 Uncharacterised protein [Yersinia kristensenii]CNK72348.1 Uncharacterised protein [Yersinia kristensenii]
MANIFIKQKEAFDAQTRVRQLSEPALELINPPRSCAVPGRYRPDTLAPAG